MTLCTLIKLKPMMFQILITSITTRIKVVDTKHPTQINQYSVNLEEQEECQWPWEQVFNVLM